MCAPRQSVHMSAYILVSCGLSLAMRNFSLLSRSSSRLQSSISSCSENGRSLTQLAHTIMNQMGFCLSVTANYHTARNVRGRKLSRISWFCSYSQKLSPQNLKAWHLWHCKSEQSVKVFSAKIVFFTNLRKVSPSKVPCYTVFNIIPNTFGPEGIYSDD